MNHSDNIIQVLDFINNNMTPKSKEKKDFGEVFTPMHLVNQILDKLPADVWNDKSLSWLDPANGMGNFPVAVFIRLCYGFTTKSGDFNQGLTKTIPDEMERRKHIIKEMLFMVEMNPKNTTTSRNLFKLLDADTEPNIWTTDSLKITSESLERQGWPTKYDIIMGNPPFNFGGIGIGGSPAWPKFVYLAFNLIKPDGYITFIHPPGWRKLYNPGEKDTQGKIWHTIRKNGWHLEYINVCDKPTKHFPIVDYYVLKAGKSSNETEYDSLCMTFENSGKKSFVSDFIPNMINTDAQQIINKLFSIEGDNINIDYTRAFRPGQSDKGKSGTPHYHFTDRTGTKTFYSKHYDKVPDYINHQKVMMTYKCGYKKGRLFAFYTDEPMGITHNSMYMLVNSEAEGEKIVKFLNSDIITFLLKITQYSASPHHKNEAKILNRLKIPKSLDDYKLSASEKALIQKVVGNKDETSF